MSKRTAQPLTVIGRWLIAALLRRRELRDQLVRQMPAGPLRDDDVAVVRAACELAVRPYFGQDYDVRMVTAFASDVRDRQPAQGRPNLMKLEAVIRSALGEIDVDLSDITPDESRKAYILAVTHVFQILSWDESDITRLVTAAEAKTMREGLRPALAASA